MDVARRVISTLRAGGVRQVVLAPGSRSAPLAYALAEAELEILVRIDERAAGFTALGLALSSGLPTAVLTTSGTAVGNLLPAVMEANHAGVPLLVLSADRPEELRGTGANQTTDQVDLFGPHVRFAADIPADTDPQTAVQTGLDAARGLLDGVPRGPVQLNLAFREPLTPQLDGSEYQPNTLSAGVPEFVGTPEFAEPQAPVFYPGQQIFSAEPWFWQVTTPAWRRSALPAYIDYRCWPSPLPMPVSGRTPSVPTGCCWNILRGRSSG